MKQKQSGEFLHPYITGYIIALDTKKDCFSNKQILIFLHMKKLISKACS